MNINKLFLGLLSTVVILGCSSSALVKDFEKDYKCYKSAQMLEENKDFASGKIDMNHIFLPSTKILTKIDRKYSDVTPSEMEELKSIISNLNEFYYDLEYGPDTGYKSVFHPIKIHNSESCLAMNEQEKIDLPIPISFLYYIYYIFL